MIEIKIVLPEITLNELCFERCVVNLQLLILQIMLCTINSFQTVDK